MNTQNCMLCYQGTVGQRIQSELLDVDRYKYWDLAPQPQKVRKQMGRRAAGFLISKIHVPTLAELAMISSEAVLELARIEEDAARVLAKSVGVIVDILEPLDMNDWRNQGPRAGESQPSHYHRHIVPVLEGDVIGGPIAAYNIASPAMTRL